MKKSIAVFVALIASLSIALVGCTTKTEPPQDPVQVQKDTQVIVRLNTGVDNFGETVEWEASLYQGAIVGEETSGRFTDWKPVNETNEVVFSVPEEVQQGSFAPFGKVNGAYIRVRTVDTASYPQLDMVSNPFTLTEGMHHQVHVWLDTEAIFFEDEDQYKENAKVLIVLFTGINGFGETGEWEASLYKGATTGDETSGRFTDWKPVDISGGVEFDLLNEAFSHDEIPWDDPANTYLRIRTIGNDAFPQFDLVTHPFTLSRGRLHMVPARMKTEFGQ